MCSNLSVRPGRESRQAAVKRSPFSRPLHSIFQPHSQTVVLTPLTLVLLRSPAAAVTGAMALQTCAQVHKGSKWLAFGNEQTFRVASLT